MERALARRVGRLDERPFLHRAGDLQRPRGAQARHRKLQGGFERGENRRSLPAFDLAGKYRGAAEKRILSQRRGLHLRDRGRDARGISGDRRGRLAAAGGRSAAGVVLQRESYEVGGAEPQMGRPARGSAESRAARYPSRENPLPHLLRHQHRPAHSRSRAQRHRGHHAARQSRRVFFRGRQPAPRARVARVGEPQAAGRKNSHPRRHQPHDEYRGASRARRRAPRALREDRRARERDGGQRLRLLVAGDGRAGNPPHGGVGEIQGDGRGRAHREQRAVGGEKLRTAESEEQRERRGGSRLSRWENGGYLLGASVDLPSLDFPSLDFPSLDFASVDLESLDFSLDLPSFASSVLLSVVFVSLVGVSAAIAAEAKKKDAIKTLKKRFIKYPPWLGPVIF